MKKLLSLLLAAATLAFAASGTKAQTRTANENSAILYEITGKNLKKPSYLFGTIHMICQKDMFSADRLKNYLGQTEQLLLEFDMDDPAVIQQAVKASMLADGKSVKDYVTAEEYAKIDAVFKANLGFSFDALQTYKPMISQTYLLSSPKVIGCQPPVVYDNFLAQTAVAQKMPVIGLESVEQQIAVIDSQPLDLQLKALKTTAENPQKDFDEFKKLMALYLSQDTDNLYKYIAEQFKVAGYSQTKMLDSRNKNWIPIIEKNIAEKPSFIAVGGGHLGGENGVVKLLREKGYKLTPIKL